MATTPARAPIAARQQDRKFYISMAIVAALIVLFGFSRSYFLKSFFGTPSLTPLVHLHGVIFTSWIVLLIGQTSLVAAGRADLHRKLGVAGALLAAIMLVVGMMTAITAARLGHVPDAGIPPLRFLTVPFFDMLIFPVLVGAALYLRRKPDYHKRLMLLATLAILAAAFGRMPLDFTQVPKPLSAFLMVDLVILAAVAYDTIRNRRLHPAFVWGGLLVIISHPLRLAVAGTDTWMRFAAWLTS